MVRLSEYRRKIAKIRAEIRAEQAVIEPETVPDYVFAGPAGQIALSELFGAKPDLFVIHNMGASCAYCTMWADGFNGVLHHLESRAAFVVTSPDDPPTQAAFAASRGWRFRMVSHAGTSFAEDMGYCGEQGCLPGVSAFRLTEGKITRVSDTGFGPDDDFCVPWHFFDLLPAGPDGWRARFSY
jgi:predicted dithiol-disulfide oxidoreductase (DUF899 family)